MRFVHSLEEWRAIPGYEGWYEASDHGRVRSLDRVITQRNGNTYRLKGKILSPTMSSHGYYGVGIGKNGQRETRTVHSLVMEAFVGPYPEQGMEIRHLDGNKLNCHLSNLRYGTCSENQEDKLAHGRHVQANRTHCPFGHELAVWNTYPQSRSVYGRRQCVACARARAHMRYHKIDKARHQEIADAQYEELRKGMYDQAA